MLFPPRCMLLCCFAAASAAESRAQPRRSRSGQSAVRRRRQPQAERHRHCSRRQPHARARVQRGIGPAWDAKLVYEDYWDYERF